MNKIVINMLSSANKVEGQGVGSAYDEQVGLVKKGLKNFEIIENSKKDADILHHYTVDLGNYMKMSTTKGVNVAHVHFLPTTLDGSIKLPKPIFAVFKKYVIDFYNKADYLVVVNPIFKKELVKNKISSDKVVYIPNYVSKDTFYKKSDKEVSEIRKKIGLKDDDFVVLGVGQVQTRKGVLDFIEIAKKMKDVQFVWCGGFSFGKITDGYNELKKIYDNPPSNVKFLGIVPRDEMNDMYNMSDILFMPSYNELFPMSILEAVNINKPLLLRDLDLYEDILFKKYMSSNNNKGFIEKIKVLKDDKKEYKKYSEYSKDISEFYSDKHVLKMWEEFYTKIYNEHREKVK
ncbi:MAG: glycosyltransferase family 4 protein [Clostridium sp.]|nr:glycosyltransferase family 4 protein [Clostridium sp.]MCM1444571.1 glycosyltransferase family 4 protein [Candidatus Amulumruptor caecigallinarius]